jgi:hypothetical protein
MITAGVLLLALPYAYLLLINRMNKDDIRRLRQEVFELKMREIER